MPVRKRHLRVILMEIDLSTLSLEELSRMYQKADREMKAALLGGADWMEVQDKRALVTELSIQIHKRSYPSGAGSPADTALRGKER